MLIKCNVDAREIADKLSDAVSQRDTAADELASAKRSLERLQRECDRLSIALASSEQSTKELEGSGSQLEASLQRYRDECDALRDELRKTSKRAHAVDEENGNLRALVRAGEEGAVVRQVIVVERRERAA